MSTPTTRALLCKVGRQQQRAASSWARASRTKRSSSSSLHLYNKGRQQQRRFLHSEATIAYYTGASNFYSPAATTAVVDPTMIVGGTCLLLGSHVLQQQEQEEEEEEQLPILQDNSLSSLITTDHVDNDDYHDLVKTEATAETSTASSSSTSTATTTASATITTIQAHGVALPTEKVLENGQAASLQGHFLRKFAFYGVEMDIYVASLYQTEPEETIVGDETEWGPLETAPADDSEDVMDDDDHYRNDDDTNPRASSSSSSSSSISVDVLLLHDYPSPRIRTAWKYEMDHSVDGTDRDYEGYREDKVAFLNLIAQKTQPNGANESWSESNSSNNDKTHHTAQKQKQKQQPQQQQQPHHEPHQILQSIQLLADGRTVVLEQGRVKGIIEGRKFQKAFLSMWFGSNPIGTPELPQYQPQQQQQQQDEQPQQLLQQQQQQPTIAAETSPRIALEEPADEIIHRRQILNVETATAQTG